MNSDPVRVVGGMLPTTDSIRLANTDQEYSYTFPSDTVKVIFRVRTSTAIRYSWNQGQVGVPKEPYHILAADAEYSVDFVTLVGQTLYFATDTACRVEIEYWRRRE